MSNNTTPSAMTLATPPEPEVMEGGSANAQPATEQPEVPFIKRVIDGREYTVLIHFKADAHDTAKDKMLRVLRMEAEKGAAFA